MQGEIAVARKWYEDVTPYMWLVLVIGSLGWVFDIFEGQIFVASSNEVMPALSPSGTPAETIDFYRNVVLGAFLAGGAFGGVLFGMLSDRLGRTRTMILTILIYSLFVCAAAISQTWWQMVIFMFIVALGTGGEWAVASAMIAEVFPKRARAQSLGIFHACSVVGTFLAILAGWLIITNPRFGADGWRWCFVIGAVPALLTLLIRWKLREPEQWIEARKQSRLDITKRAGRILDLFSPGLIRNTLVGLSLATIGLATFWGVHIVGKDLLRDIVQRSYLVEAGASTAAETKQVLDVMAPSIKRWEMAGMALVTIGGGIGLLSFGPLAERFGRRATFLFFHVGGLASALVVFQGMANVSATTLCWMLPVFGYLTLGLHAGYAIYFPELFPTRLRGTGGGFCFNGGRLLAASIIVVKGSMRGRGLSLEDTASILALLFLVGILVLLVAPETRGRELPE